MKIDAAAASMVVVSAAIALLVGFLASSQACAPNRPTEAQADADVRAMRFQRHANGLCFGVIRFQTYSGFEGVSITHVPQSACDPPERQP